MGWGKLPRTFWAIRSSWGPSEASAQRALVSNTMATDADLRGLLQEIVDAYNALGRAEVPPPAHVGPTGWVDARPKLGEVAAAQEALSRCMARARLVLEDR